MKKFFILICTLFTIGAASAQCPQYLAFDTTVCGNTINKNIDATVLESRLCGYSVTIYFNDSTTSLNGSPQVYFHTGPEFVPFEGWQSAYTRDSAMQKIGPHLWTIKFNPRSFYGYSPDSCLNSVVCGFRDSNYVNYVKCGSADIFIVVASGAAVNTCASASFVTATYTHAPVSYTWNDANTNGIRTFTTGGNYKVTASGIGGCSVTGTVKITLDNKKVSIGDDTIECSTYSYVFVATPGFSTYQWLDANAGTSNTHQALTADGGMYWVHAIDSNGCASNDTATVHLSATGFLNIPNTLSSCPGIPVSVDASTNINANGDSIVIIYNANLGQSQLAGDTNVYFYSAPQFYPFAVWPANDPYTVGNYGLNDGVGRMTSLGNDKWRIAIDPQAYYHFSPDTALNGIWMIFRNFDGSKTGKDTTGNNIFVYTVPLVPTSTSDAVVATRKAGPVSYSWSNGAHTAADTFSTSGTYYVTATDVVCMHTDSVVVSFASSGVINIGADTAVCSAHDSVIISAGVGYAHYTWSNGDTTSSIKVNTAATYTVTATSSGGCISIGHRKLSLANPVVSLGPDVVKCTNTPAMLTATLGFSSYEWIGRSGIVSNTFSASKTGTYWVEAIDSSGCAAYDTVMLRYSEVLQLSLQDTFNSCPGSLVGLDANENIVINGDSIVIFFDGTNTPLVGANKVYMHSGPQFTPSAGWDGAYTVGNWGQDDGVGKMDSLGNNHWSITIFPQSYYKYSPDSTLTGIWMVLRNANGTVQTNPNIFLDLSTLNPIASVPYVSAIHKDAGNLIYAWSNGGMVASIAVDSTGTYTVTVSDGTCSNTASTYVNLSSSLHISIGNDTSICPSGSVRFNAGAGYTHYHWNNGDTTQAITVSAAGSYSVTVTNGSGCTGSDTAVVHISGTKVNAGADITRCNKLPVSLSASSGYVSYEWFGIGTSSQTYSAVNDGCYWVEATDVSGCTSYDTVCVSTSGVEGLPSHDTLTTCAGVGVSFDAATSINASGDSLVITFDATQNANSAPLLGAHKVYMHSAPQFYSFAPWGTSIYTVGHYGQDDGLGEMDSVGPNKWQITIYPSCYYHYSPDTPLNGIWMVFRNANGSAQSQGGDINLYTAGAGGPTTPYAGLSGAFKSTNNITYSWSNGVHTAVDTFTTSGTYYLTATDGSCSKIDTVLVNQGASVNVNLGNDTCTGGTGSVILNAGSGFSTYLWSTGASTQTIVANLPNTYWVQVTNSSGCTGRDSIIVSQGATVNLGKDTCINSGGSYLLNAGAGATSYLWSTGATTDTLRVTSAGTYAVVVNEGGCVARDTVVIGNCGHTIEGCKAVAYFKVLSISPSNTVTLRDSSYNEYGTVSYVWNYGDGTNDSTGAGNSVHTYAMGGTDTITLIVCDSIQNGFSTCGCDTFSQIISFNVGISEIIGLNGVSLYPNPASNSCILEMNALESMEVSIDVNNILGAAIGTTKYQVVSGQNRLTLDLAGMASGMYTVTIRSANGTMTKKLDIIK
jgi:hypothetical protein